MSAPRYSLAEETAIVRMASALKNAISLENPFERDTCYLRARIPESDIYNFDAEAKRREQFRRNKKQIIELGLDRVDAVGERIAAFFLPGLVVALVGFASMCGDAEAAEIAREESIWIAATPLIGFCLFVASLFLVGPVIDYFVNRRAKRRTAQHIREMFADSPPEMRKDAEHMARIFEGKEKSIWPRD